MRIRISPLALVNNKKKYCKHCEEISLIGRATVLHTEG